MILSIVSFVIAFGLLVLVHEFGHFWVARRSGIAVEKFSIGFGPKLFGFKWKETLFQISLFPLGGFVKMKGESDEEKIDPSDQTSFSNKTTLVRSAVVSAGPLMNLVLSFILMPLVFWIGKPEPVFLKERAVIEQVLPNSPADQAGIRKGDTVFTVDGKPVANWVDLIQAVQIAGSKTFPMEVEREGKRFALEVRPQWNDQINQYMIGIQGKEPTSLDVTIRSYPLKEAIVVGFKANWDNLVLTFQVLKKLFTFELSYKALGGPVQIAYTLAKASASGLADFIFFTAFLSLQLAILNLLPIPVLDGGHLVFFLIEGVLRRPLSLKTRMVAQQVGLVLLLTLILMVTWNDVQRLFFR